MSEELPTDRPDVHSDYERQPLLGRTKIQARNIAAGITPAKLVAGLLSLGFFVSVFVFLGLYKHEYELSDDPHTAALQILGRHPVIVCSSLEHRQS